jgi:hypothetical protein
MRSPHHASKSAPQNGNSFLFLNATVLIFLLVKGILIEIIIQLGIRIAPILGLMILILFSFTYSFIVLFRRQDDSSFQEQYESGSIPDKNNDLGSDAALSDQSQQNIFKDVFLAFSTVWFFLYGVFDPILVEM